MLHANRMQIFNDNPVLKAFGIHIDEGSNEVEIGVRHNPHIMFANRQVVTPDVMHVLFLILKNFKK